MTSQPSYYAWKTKQPPLRWLRGRHPPIGNIPVAVFWRDAARLGAHRWAEYVNAKAISPDESSRR